LPEVLDTLVHGLEGIANVGSQQLWVNVDEGVVHPRLMPLQPDSHCHPQRFLYGSKSRSSLPTLSYCRRRRRERGRGRRRDRKSGR